MPPGLEQYNVTVVTNTEEIIPELDVLMALRIQRERMGEQYFPNDLEYAKYFGIDDEKLKGAKNDLIIMHPGPVNRGVELAQSVIDGPRSVILPQVTNGVAIRMALLYLLMGTHDETAQ